MRITAFVNIILLFSAGLCYSADYYDWNVRTDRDGKPAGIFATTPFPITESSTTYSVKNDEQPTGKTFYLGTKSYVDGGYGVDTGNCQSFTSPCRTISYAIGQAGSGNKTVIVRGAHGSFDGYYNNSGSGISLSSKSGTDDTHRFTIVGYGQERPVMTGGTDDFTGTGFQYVTLQRLSLENTTDRSIKFNGPVHYINIIDVRSYNNCTSCNTTDGSDGDGAIYVDGVSGQSSYVWVFHTTAEHTYMKCYKLADNTDYSLVEWSVAKECGYWPGISKTPKNHPYGFDFAGSAPYVNDGVTLRYNIAETTMGGNEIRYAPKFSVHHNEFIDPIHMDDYATHASFYSNAAGFTIVGTSYGNFYSNIIRDNSDTEHPWLLGFELPDDSVNTINVYNNLIYNAAKGYPVRLSWGAVSPQINFYNNVVQSATSTSLFYTSGSPGAGANLRIKNNIFHQAGSGSCLEVGSRATWDYNLYYFPSGSRGVTAAAHDINSGLSTNPNWVNAPPWGAWGTNDGAFISNSAWTGTNDLSSVYTTDFFGNPRGSTWTIGSYAIQEPVIVPGKTPLPPSIVSVQ